MAEALVRALFVKSVVYTAIRYLLTNIYIIVYRQTFFPLKATFLWFQLTTYDDDPPPLRCNVRQRRRNVWTRVLLQQSMGEFLFRKVVGHI